MSFIKKTLFIAATVMSFSSLAKAQNQEEFSKIQQAINPINEAGTMIKEMMSNLGMHNDEKAQNINDSGWLVDDDVIDPGEDRLVDLLLNISRKQVKAADYARFAAELYWSDYEAAQDAKQSACQVSKHAKRQAQKGLSISRNDRHLNNRDLFITRFESVLSTLRIFRDLLECKDRYNGRHKGRTDVHHGHHH